MEIKNFRIERTDEHITAYAECTTSGRTCYARSPIVTGREPVTQETLRERLKRVVANGKRT